MSACAMQLLFWSGLAVALSAPAVTAQDRDDRPVIAEEAARAGWVRPPADREASGMRDMARATESVAGMCRTMMQREMRYRPCWIAALSVVGTLLVIALILFVVPEIRWIRSWGLRVKAERKTLGR